MKKALLLASLCLLSTPVFAANNVINQNALHMANTQTPQGGFTGPSVVIGISTIKEAINAGMFSDDTPVTLTGHITHSLGGELYQFKDNTGEIAIKIDHDKWFGLQVTPETKITIQGEIDKELNSIEIDVDRVQKAS